MLPKQSKAFYLFRAFPKPHIQLNRKSIMNLLKLCIQDGDTWSCLQEASIERGGLSGGMRFEIPCIIYKSQDLTYQTIGDDDPV